MGILNYWREIMSIGDRVKSLYKSAKAKVETVFGNDNRPSLYSPYLVLPLAVIIGVVAVRKANSFTYIELASEMTGRGFVADSPYNFDIDGDFIPESGDVGGPPDSPGKTHKRWFADDEANYSSSEESTVTSNGGHYTTFNPNWDLEDAASKIEDELMGTNTAPEFTSATLTSTNPKVNDTLGVDKSGWFDVNGDPEGYDHQWERNSSDVNGATSGTLYLDSGIFSKGDTVSCTVTADDGITSGNTIETPLVTIVNSSPSFTGAEIAQNIAYTDTDLTLNMSGWNDPDGDPEGYQYQWKKNGNPMPGENSSGLSSAKFGKGDLITCDVTPYDGESQGPKITTPDVTIQNSPPSIDSAVLDNYNGSPTQIFTASPVNPQDKDEDAVSFLYRWQVKDGENWVYLSGETSSTISGLSLGTTFRAEITPHDGEEPGVPEYTPQAVIDSSGVGDFKDYVR